MGSLKWRSAVYFCAMACSTAISLAVLPFATRLIGPAEYGTLALATAYAALITAVAQSVQGYVLPEHLPHLLYGERHSLLLSAMSATSAVGLVAAAVVIPVAYFTAPWILEVTPIEQFGMALCAAATLVAVPWVVCGEALMVEGNAVSFAIGMVGQSAVNALVTLLFLFVIPRPEIALLLGYCAGQVALAVVAVACLRQSFKGKVRRRWFGEMRRSAFATGRAALSETGRTLFERSYLGIRTDATDLGLFAHAQLYRNVAMMGLNSVSRAAWPINLREAREAQPNFRVTLASWAPVQAGIAAICVAFALVGREVIGLLTSGKFVGAAPMALIFLAALLLQTTAKREQSILIAYQQGARVSNAQTVGIFVGLAVVLAGVPFFGAIAAACAFLCQTVVQRLLVIWQARKFAATPMKEHWVLRGLIATAAVSAWNELFAPGLLARAVVLVLAASLVLVFLWRELKDYLHIGRATGPLAHPATD